MTARRVAYLMAGAALVALGLAAGAACGSTGPSDAGGGTASGASLEGTSWRLTGWSGSGQDPSDFTITAEFNDGRVGGTSAVNQYGGPYAAGDDGSISFGDLASTMMAGPEPDMRAEKTYLDLLATIAHYTLAHDALTLSGDSGQKLVYSRSTASAEP